MSFDIICFDCDSTLSKIEGIDELAERVGLGPEMSRLTNAAMNGEVALEAVYEQRLAAIKPTRESIDWLAERYIAERVDGVEAVFAELLASGKALHIISGGLRQAILPLAEYLGVAVERVHAVDVYFDDDGSYLGFDKESPLARNGGKAEICRQLQIPSAQLVMVGDGKTDMEAKQAGAYVIGFGGVVNRAIVRELADVYCPGPNLSETLLHIL
ncbi:MAG: HAD-IB family phosphatase [Methylococcales bacterium]|nr:HAD-IB family phosphatase [Methylococcaceae bacterium]